MQRSRIILRPSVSVATGTVWAPAVRACSVFASPAIAGRSHYAHILVITNRARARAHVGDEMMSNHDALDTD